MAAKPKISPNAFINLEAVSVGKHVTIHDGAVVCRDTVLENFVKIGRKARIGEGSNIGWGVRIGDDVKVGRLALILSHAEICRDSVKKRSTNARHIGDEVTIGEGVLLHNEVELGDGAIIPTQQTIASIGNFGDRRRTITIYGSDEGPRFSVGCQIGIDYSTFQYRVGYHSASTPRSANTYVPFMGAFEEIGDVVQAEYEKERVLVDELKAMRAQKFAHLTGPMYEELLLPLPGGFGLV